MADEKNTHPAKNVALSGLLFALAICLSLVESILPSFIPVPGIKLGLSNVVTMFCVFALGYRNAFLIAVLKAGFSLIVRGWASGILSLCGGLLSTLMMVLLLFLLGTRVSYGAVSMVGAVSHNMGQLAGAAWLLGFGDIMLYYVPVLIISGVIMGLLTAIVLRAVLPKLENAIPSTKKEAFDFDKDV